MNPSLPTTLHSMELSFFTCYRPRCTIDSWVHLRLEQIKTSSSFVGIIVTVCSCPWQLFGLGIADRPLFETSSRSVAVKITLSWNYFVFCECETIQLLSVVFCLLEIRINSTSGFLYTRHQTNGDYWKECSAVIETHVSDRFIFILPTFVLSVTGLYPRCEGQLHSHE